MLFFFLDYDLCHTYDVIKGICLTGEGEGGDIRGIKG